MAEEEIQSLSELRANLEEYVTQHAAVRLSLTDPTRQREKSLRHSNLCPQGRGNPTHGRRFWLAFAVVAPSNFRIKFVSDRHTVTLKAILIKAN
eukprot:3480875-Pyramimonas_sp.AAC.1